MEKRYLPEEIKRIVGNAAYKRDNTGMSGSEVLPVPEIPVYLVEGQTAYTLMSRIQGTMLCDEDLLKTPDRLIRLAAVGIKRLWAVDVKDCPLGVSRLEERLKAARFQVENNLVDMENVEPETFAPGGFANPMELLEWLEQNRPEEDLVLTHGDFCLPNVFVKGNKISGYIDIGKMGPADRWQDIAIVMRSLAHNFAGKYNGGKAYFQFEPESFLRELGMEMDEEKNRYYLLLDELF